MSNNTAKPGVAIGQFLDKCRLTEMKARIDRHLGEFDLVYGYCLPCPIEIVKQISSVEFRYSGKPAITKPFYVIEMYMTVNDWKFWHFCFLGVLNHVQGRRLTLM